MPAIAKLRQFFAPFSAALAIPDETMQTCISAKNNGISFRTSLMRDKRGRLAENRRTLDRSVLPELF
jgi:hypothetical protein